MPRLPPEEALLASMPPSTARDRLARLARIGRAFADQQRGRRPGVLRRHVADLVQRLEPRTFDALLVELELAALRRELRGPDASPIERVDRGFEIVTYHDPRAGRRQVTFKRVRNIAKLRNPENR